MLVGADQLVLDYLSRVADAARGVLRTDQRLEFVQRVRARLERDRAGSTDPRRVAKVIARLGPPEALVEREARRLAEAAGDGERPGGGRGAADGSALPEEVEDPTEAYPYVVDDLADRLPHRPARSARPAETAATSRPVPPGVLEGRRRARLAVARQATRRAPFAGLRRVAMAAGNPMATDGRDARTVVLNNQRETAGMVLLIVAALLVPFRLPSVEIFPVPLLVWAVAALIVLTGTAWDLRDRIIGILAPLVGYGFGGALVGGIRAPDTGLSTLIGSFHEVSGTMFILGTVAGVCWLGFRLLHP